jgi:hypothetical protein
MAETCPDGQVEGVLTGAVPDLLSRWVARNALDPASDAVADPRSALLRKTLDAALADIAGSPAARLERSFVLLGQAFLATVLASQLQLLVDALVPEQLLDAEHAAHDGRSVRLVKKRNEPGWRLRGELTDEVGARLQAELDAQAWQGRGSRERLSPRRATQAQPYPRDTFSGPSPTRSSKKRPRAASSTSWHISRCPHAVAATGTGRLARSATMTSPSKLRWSSSSCVRCSLGRSGRCQTMT